MRRLILLAAFLLIVATANAQLGIYGGYTAAKLNTANTGWLNGGTFGVYYDGSHPLVNFGVDVRGSVLSSGPNLRITSVTAGPRVAFHLPVVPLKPYAEITIGGAHGRVGQGFASYDSGGLDVSAIGGVDVRLLPHIDWRVIDYSFSRIQAIRGYENNITTGIVFRIPFS